MENDSFKLLLLQYDDSTNESWRDLSFSQVCMKFLWKLSRLYVYTTESPS